MYLYNFVLCFHICHSSWWSLTIWVKKLKHSIALYVTITGRFRRVQSCPDHQGIRNSYLDPVHQVCDISVKIADLGNACWVVSLTIGFLTNNTVLFKIFHIVEILLFYHLQQIFCGLDCGVSCIWGNQLKLSAGPTL